MIPGLDGLRAIAILLVFAYHADLIEFGWAGVQLFFVLSGFLITGILLDMKETLPSGKYFAKFYGRRFLRIFPLYYFYLGLMALVAYRLMSEGFRPKYMQIFLDQVWHAAFYLYDFFYRSSSFQQSQFLDHFWSLSVEEQFYIIWPLMLLLVPLGHLKRLFLVFIFLGIVFRTALYLLYISGSSLWTFQEPFELVIYSWPLSHLDAFAFGAYISRYPIWRPRAQLLFLALLVPIIGFTATYFATGNIGLISALGYDLPLRVGYQFLWGPTLLNYFFALLIYCVVHEGILTRFLNLSWLRYLGKISYGMYVYHFPIMWFVARFLEERMQAETANWIYVVVSLSTTILIASLSYYLLERPILNLKDRFFSWSKAPAVENPG
ncbi:MAG: acyltransferase [Chloroflexi bacterium]|nr:MAG: acyltransferase [Chloroflexota bacterium]